MGSSYDEIKRNELLWSLIVLIISKYPKMNNVEYINPEEERYLFADAVERLHQFEALLKSYRIQIQPGSILEQLCLNTIDVLEKHRHPETIDTGKDFRQELAEVIGLQEIVRKLLRHKWHPDFPQLVQHLRLLNECHPTQNTPAAVTDEGSNKSFELLFGLCSMDVGRNLVLDNPVVSTGDNPDILVDIEGVRWGFACKVLHSINSQTFFDNLKKGIDQIEKSAAATGVVLFNLKNVLKHDEYWQLTNRAEYLAGAEPLFSAFLDREAAFLRLTADGERIRQAILAGIEPQHWVALFDRKRAIPGFLLFIQMCAGLRDAIGVHPSLFGYLSMTPIGRNPTVVQMSVLRALNRAMHNQPIL